MAQCAVPTKEGKDGVRPSSPRPVMALLATGTMAISVAMAGLPALTSPAAAASHAGAADSIRQSEWWLRELGVNNAWITSQGSGVTVAVLSDGVDASQADLVGAVTSAPALPGAPTATGVYFGEQGTPIASLVAGRGHGAGGLSGIIGVAPQAKILSIPVTLPADDPQLSQPAVAGAIPDAIAAGIRYAVAHGAKVIDLPLDPSQPGSAGGGATAAAGGSAAEQSAVNYAEAHDVVLVAPAGDNATSSDARNYPAAYHGVIAVGAFNRAFVKAPWSSHQSYVTITAAGDGVVAATGSSYETMHSTSAASAVVTGVVALIRARYPHLSASAIRQALTSTTSYRRANGKAAGSGYGAVNAGRALAAAALLAAPAAARAGFGAQPRQSPAAARATSATHALGSELIQAGEISAGLLVLLLLVIAIYVAFSRKRRKARHPAVATEWAHRQAQPRYPLARDVGADRMLEFFASPIALPESPTAQPIQPAPDRRPRADRGAFAAVAGRRAAALEAAGQRQPGQPDDVIQPANVIQPGGVVVPTSTAEAGNWATISPASRAVTRRPSVSGAPPWDPAAPPNSELPWAAVPGRHSATAQPVGPPVPPVPERLRDEPADASRLRPTASPAGQAGWSEPPAGIRTDPRSGEPANIEAPWGAAAARNQLDDWDGKGDWPGHQSPMWAGTVASWQAPQPPAPASGYDAGWQEPQSRAPVGRSDTSWPAQQPHPQSSSAAQWPLHRSRTGGDPTAGTRPGPLGPAGVDDHEADTPPPRIASSGLPIRQPRAATQPAPLSPSGSLWEPATSQPGDDGGGQDVGTRDRGGRPIYTWDPAAAIERYRPLHGDPYDSPTE